MLNNQKGFTLIELMVVVVIIGILAAIALPNFLSMQDRAKESEVKSNVHTVQLVVEDFKTQYNGVKPNGFVTAPAAAVAPAAPVNGVGGSAVVPATIKNPFLGTIGAPGIVAEPNTAVAPLVNAASANAQGSVAYVALMNNTAGDPYLITGTGKLPKYVAVTSEGL